MLYIAFFYYKMDPVFLSALVNAQNRKYTECQIAGKELRFSKKIAF